MKKGYWKIIGNCVLTMTLCSIANSIFRHIGIGWLNAYAFAIGFLFAKIYDQKTTIII